MSGYKDLSIILAKYIDVNPVAIRVCNIYSRSYADAQLIQFYFQNTLTMSQLLDTTIRCLNLNSNSKSNNFKIFLELGVELKESNIKNLQNNDMLLIASDTETSEYSEYAQYTGHNKKGTDWRATTQRIGMFGAHVGKTALAYRFCTNEFYENYYTSIEDNYYKKIKIDNEKSLTLEIFLLESDFCENLAPMAETYMREEDVIIFVFSVIHRKSVDTLNRLHRLFVRMFDQEDEKFVPPIIVVGTHVDLRDIYCKRNEDYSYITSQEGLKLMKKFGGVRYIETSAKTGYHVQELFATAARLADNRKFYQFRNDQDLTTTTGKCACCQMM